jgi:hypothetical protein
MPEPLPLDHAAWHDLYEHVVNAIRTGAHSDWARNEMMREFGGCLADFQQAVADRLVVVAPQMRPDGMYYVVRVRVEDGLGAIARIHASRLSMTDEVLEADQWVANQTALAAGAPDGPEGVEEA